ncbi:MAG: hypothetical protein A2Z88_04675 [Omnitrophica WOR_2 bacterium GWA2_47_8]|nr:MAG: hypothetical protein A2Z88_04675 [Omnitrophica WOR_2 bacterium GWA2_47_8]
MDKLRIFIFILSLLSFSPAVHAFWVWTPETNRWINPKYNVKENPKLQLDYALEFYNSKEYKKASEEFRKLIKHYPKAREAAEAQYYLGVVLTEEGTLFKAFKEYQLVIDKYPFSERIPEIVKKQYEIGNMFLEGKGKRSEVLQAVVGGDYDIIEVFRTVIRNAPYGEYAAPSQYKIGLYLLEKRLYQEARDEFEKTINDYPNTEWAKAASFQIAMSDSKRSSDPQYDQQVTKTAVEEFKEFAQKYPDAELSDNAQKQIQSLREKEAENNYVVAEFYEKHKKFDAAKIYYSSIVEDYRDTEWAKKALEKIQKINSKVK